MTLSFNRSQYLSYNLMLLGDDDFCRNDVPKIYREYCRRAWYAFRLPWPVIQVPSIISPTIVRIWIYISAGYALADKKYYRRGI